MTRNLFTPIVFLAGFLAIAPAQAACHFNTGNAIVCLSPEGAAYAFKKFGFDIKTTNLSYNRQLMQEAGCSRAYNPNYKAAIIKVMDEGRIATPQGWVTVVSAVINNSDTFYFAKAYVTGKCEKYVAPVFTMQDGHIVEEASAPAATNNE